MKTILLIGAIFCVTGWAQKSDSAAMESKERAKLISLIEGRAYILAQAMYEAGFGSTKNVEFSAPLVEFSKSGGDNNFKESNVLVNLRKRKGEPPAGGHAYKFVFMNAVAVKAELVCKYCLGN